MANASSPTYPPYLFNTPAWSDALGWGVDKPQCYTTIHCADVTGNGQAEILARSATGIVGAYLCKELGSRLIRLPSGPPLSDRQGYDHPQYYGTIQYADVDGDGRAELIVRRSGGIQTFKLNDPASDQDIPTGSPILPSFMIWSALTDNDPAWSDEAGWDEARYYTTIQAADIDGDGKAELLARGPGGIVAYRYDPSARTWQVLPDGPDWSDAGGWDEPQYYTTIQAADIDGDGKAELIARGYDGIVAYRYDPTTQTWHELPAGPGWSNDGGWDKAQYYSTIQAADIDGDGRAELVARGAGGIVAYRYDPTTQTWHELPAGPDWADHYGWDEPQYYTTIQAADVDGDGRAELFARAAGGIEAYRYDPTTQTWHALPAGPDWSDDGGWDDPQYRSTIQAADIDGDGKAELLARNADGMIAFAYDPSTEQWQQIAPKTTKVPFPQYADEELKAYTYISAKLLPNAVNPSIRDQYNKEGSNPTTWTSTLTHMRRNHHISEKAWHTVKTQLLLEFSCVAHVQAYFSQANELITNLTLSRSLIVQEVSASVDITATQKSSSGISATLSTMMLGIVNAVAIAVSDGAGVAAGVFASVMGAALAADPSDDSAVIREAAELEGWIETQFMNSTAASAHYEQDVLCDWGLLHTLGTLTGGGGPWERSKEYVNTAVDAAKGSFKLWIYQKLMPIKYESITLDPSVSLNEVEQQETQEPLRVDWVQKIGDDSYNFYYIGNYNDGWVFPTATTMNDIWSLGATKENFFLRKNGWDQFKLDTL